MRFVAGRGRRGGGAVGRGAMAELLLAGALQRSAIGKQPGEWEQKKEWHQRVMPFSLFLVSGTYMLFVQYDSTHRACTCASTALCALVRVDNIDFTSRDSSYWALACTCTASCAIASNFVSHSC